MIFYLSCTGNTRWAAERLAQSTGDRLCFIPDVIDGDCHFVLEEGERMGIVFPVHGWRPPKIVREFISKLTIDKVQPAAFTYALCTAGDSIGKTIEILQGDLSARDITLDAAYSIIMPESYVGLPFMDVDTKEREQEKLKKAEEDMEGIVRHVAGSDSNLTTQTKCPPPLHKGPIPWFFSGPVGAFFVRLLVRDTPFRVEDDRCIKCGKCVAACPVHDIDGGKGLSPKWKHNGRCLTCFACYHQCPTHAIEFGNRTRRKGQYKTGFALNDRSALPLLQRRPPTKRNDKRQMI